IVTIIFFASKMSSSNDIDDEESTSTLSSEKASNDKQRKAYGRPFDPWSRRDLLTFKMHIARNCPNAPLEAQLFYFKQLNEDNEDQTSNKKRKADLKDNEEIPKLVENEELSIKRQEQLEDSMCLAFVCAGIPFNVAGNENVHAWLQNLGPEVKMESELRSKNYITLAHRLNLICKDIMKESFSKRVLSQATLIAQFFKSSHIANSALEHEIQINIIVGGGRGFKRGHYRKIATCASTLWKAFGKSESSCRQLLGQLVSYKENELPFDGPFEPDCQTPQTWWKLIED
ncbi:27222_t:CDS:2, partial [Racocetra persica]